MDEGANFAMQLGKRIRRARVDSGLTQNELACRARVGLNYIPRLERGEFVPSVESVFRIASVLGVSLDEVCGRVPAPRDLVGAVDALVRLNAADVASLQKVANAVDVFVASLRCGMPVGAGKAMEMREDRGETCWRVECGVDRDCESIASADGLPYG